jgi:hypothetical protein
MLQEASHDSGRGKWISSAKWLHHGSLATGVFTLLWVRHDHDFEISNAAAMAVQRPWSTAPAVKMALHMQKQKGDMCVCEQPIAPANCVVRTVLADWGAFL